MLYDVENFSAHAPGTQIAAWGAPATAFDDGRFGRLPALQLALKRGFDVVLSLLLLIAFAPLLIAIALAVRLIDGAPVLYWQERYGRHGVPFNIVKFRTMSCDEPGRRFVQVSPGDERVTRLGAFLRRTSLDELPQLLNVLVGDMSLIGPRPHAVAMEEENFRLYPRAARRLTMRPGMTGLAQIRGLRGPTATRQQLRARLNADVEYVEGWTLRRDLRILLQTPSAWIFGRNAV
jgi:putative colanic acid biosysnthesis UDP-glucose lipid carrier transferase